MRGHLWQDRDRRLQERVCLRQTGVHQTDLRTLQQQFQLSKGIGQRRNGDVAIGQAGLDKRRSLLGVLSFHDLVRAHREVAHVGDQLVLD